MISSGEAFEVLCGWKLRNSNLYGHILSKEVKRAFGEAEILDVDESKLKLRINTLVGGISRIEDWTFSLADAALRRDISENDPHFPSISSTSVIDISWSDGRRVTLWETPEIVEST